MNRKLRVFLLAVLAVVLTASFAFADTYYRWKGGDSGKWEDKANWQMTTNENIATAIWDSATEYPGASMDVGDDDSVVALFQSTNAAVTFSAKSLDIPVDISVDNQTFPNQAGIDVKLTLGNKSTLNVTGIAVHAGSALGSVASLTIDGSGTLSSKVEVDVDVDDGTETITITPTTVDLSGGDLSSLTLNTKLDKFQFADATVDANGELILGKKIKNLGSGSSITVNNGGLLEINNVDQLKADSADEEALTYTVGEKGTLVINTTMTFAPNSKDLTAAIITMNGDLEVNGTFTIGGDKGVLKAENGEPLSLAVTGGTLVVNTAEAISSDVKSVDLAVEKGATVEFKKEVNVAGLDGEGTVKFATVNFTTEDDNTDYSYTDFEGSLTATKATFANGATYPFGGNKNVKITAIEVGFEKTLGVSGDLGDIKVNLVTVSKDGSYKDVGSLDVRADAAIKTLVVDGVKGSTTPATITFDGDAAEEGPTLTVESVTFFNNYATLSKDFKLASSKSADLCALVVGEGSATGTLVIKGSSNVTGTVADKISGDAINVKGGTLRVEGTLADNNIYVSGVATLSVKNGVKLPGKLTFGGGTFVTELTEDNVDDEFAVTVADKIAIEGKTTIEVEHSLGDVRGTEFALLKGKGLTGADGNLTYGGEDSPLSADFEILSTDEAIYLKAMHQFVTLGHGDAKFDVPASASKWDAVARWEEGQFYITVPLIVSGDASLVEKYKEYMMVAFSVGEDDDDGDDKGSFIVDEKSSTGISFLYKSDDVLPTKDIEVTMDVTWSDDLYTQNSKATIDNLTTGTFKGFSYKIKVPNGVIGSADILGAFTNDETSTAELELVSPEIAPDENAFVKVTGLTAYTTKKSTSSAPELVNGVYVFRDAAIKTETKYVLPVEGGTRTVDNVVVLVDDNEYDDLASIDTTADPAVVEIAFEAFDYNDEAVVEREIKLKGKKTLDGAGETTVTTEAVTLRIISSDVSFDVPAGAVTEATYNESGDVTYDGFAIDIDDGNFESANVLTGADWFEVKVNKGEILVSLIDGITTTKDTTKTVTIEATLDNGTVKYYQWTVEVKKAADVVESAYEIVAAKGDLETTVSVDAVADYALVLKVSPDVTSAEVEWKTDETLPDWLTFAEDEDGQYVSSVDAAAAVSGDFTFTVTATLSKGAVSVDVKISVVDATSEGSEDEFASAVSGDAVVASGDPFSFTIDGLTVKEAAKASEKFLRVAAASDYTFYVGGAELDSFKLTIDDKEFTDYVATATDKGVEFTVNTEGMSGKQTIKITAVLGGEDLGITPVVFAVAESKPDYAATTVSADTVATVANGVYTLSGDWVINNVDELKEVTYNDDGTISFKIPDGVTVEAYNTENGEAVSFTADAGSGGKPTGEFAITTKTNPVSANADGTFTATFTATGDDAASATTSVPSGVIASADVSDDRRTITVTGTVPTTEAASYDVTVTAYNASGDKDEATLTVTFTPASGPEPVTTPEITLSGIQSTIASGSSFDVTARLNGISDDDSVNWTVTFDPTSLNITTVPTTLGNTNPVTFKVVLPTVATSTDVKLTMKATVNGKDYSKDASFTITASSSSSPRSSGGGGGCDAGFGALALLVAAPLFIRKRK